MSKRQFKLSSDTSINILRANGRLSLKGSSKPLFSYSSDREVSVQQDGSIVHVSADSDMKGSVPKDSIVTVQVANGRFSGSDLHLLQIDAGKYSL